MYQQQKVNKDMRQTTNRVDGVYYDSILEAQEAQNIIERLNAGEITEWKKQYKLEFYIVIESGKPVIKCNPTETERRYGYFLENYYMDFALFFEDGTIEFIEVKGQMVGDWKRKWNMVQAVFGDDPNYILKLKT